MVIIAGTVQIKPEVREEALTAARQVAVATQAEAGCVIYQFYADITEPNKFLAFEVWETDEALANHFQTEHIQVFQQKLPDFLAGKPDIKRYEISSVSDL